MLGRTGAGKTTMASLLLRFYDPLAGALLLDGHDLRDLKLAWVRQQVSVVLQDPILFSTTIADNIAYGLPGATPEQIRQAAVRAPVLGEAAFHTVGHFLEADPLGRARARRSPECQTYQKQDCRLQIADCRS